MTDRINDIVNIFNAFKSNEDFYIEILKEALSAGKDDEARKIVRARDELKNGYEISKDTVELIKNNIDKYINIINKLNEKDKDKESNEFTTAKDTYTINIDDEKEISNDTFTLTDSNIINNNDDEKKEKEDNEATNNIGDTSNTVDRENTPDIINNESLDDVNVVYSSNIAKNNLEKELAQVNRQIIAVRNSINNSEKMPSKKLYQQLFQLESYRDKLQSKLDNINLEESYGNNTKIVNNDNRLNSINDKIKENKDKLNSNKPKFVKAILSNKIKNLQKQQGRIKEKQRTIVNRDLLKYYKYSFKNSKADSKSDAIDQYYQDKKDLLQEKKDAILNNVDEYNNNIFTNAKNKFYKYKSMPTDLRIKHIENLQKHNTLKDKVGKLVGFNHIKAEIANKLYPKVQSTKRQAIDRLRELSGYLQNVQQYNPGMEDLYNNLIPEQPSLEATVRQR